MKSQWSVDKAEKYTIHRRIVRITRRIITGSVWFEVADGQYHWMATSSRELRFGVSKSLRGAKGACSKAMNLLRREIE